MCACVCLPLPCVACVLINLVFVVADRLPLCRLPFVLQARISKSLALERKGADFMTSPTLLASTQTRLHLLGDDLRPPFVPGGQEIDRFGIPKPRESGSGLCGLVCPSRTSERGGEGYCVKEGGREEGERERERAVKVRLRYSLGY